MNIDKYRQEFIKDQNTKNYQIASTLTFAHKVNYANGQCVRITEDEARECLKKFQAKLSRLLFGRYWYKPGAPRIEFIAIKEHHDTNLHYHVAINIPLEALNFKYRQKDFYYDSRLWQLLIESIWQDIKLVKYSKNEHTTFKQVTNTAKTKPIYDLRGWLGYMTKTWKYSFFPYLDTGQIYSQEFTTQ